MMSYRDRTFCPFYRDCASAADCSRPLTPEVEAAAKQWWGSDDAPIARFVDKPHCHSTDRRATRCTAGDREG